AHRGSALPTATAHRRSFRVRGAAAGASDTGPARKGPPVESSTDARPAAFRTAGGITVRRSTEPCDPEVLTTLVRDVENRRGGVLSSGMEYPGRYSRWHLGYVDPYLEIAARGRRVIATALNGSRRVLQPLVARAVAEHGPLQV